MTRVATQAEMLEEADRLERQAELRQRWADDLRRRAGDLPDGVDAAVGWVHPGIWEATPAAAVRDATRESLGDVEAGADDLLHTARRLDHQADKMLDEAWQLRRSAEIDDISPYLGL